jgi:superfamily II DNA or RNA helicase
MSVELTEKLLSNAGGWEVMKRARVYVQQQQVLSSHWAAPLLRGVVQADQSSFRASMVIKSAVDIENLCNCRDAREWGKICAHGVAVGLHWIQQQNPAAESAKVPVTPVSARGSTAFTPTKPRSSVLQSPGGEPAELHLVFPPNLEPALTRGRVMLAIEAHWDGGHSALAGLPSGRSFSFSPQDQAVINWAESLTRGPIPGFMQIESRDLAMLLTVLMDHPHLLLGKSPVRVSSEAWSLPVAATLEVNGEIVVCLKSASPPGVIGENWAWVQGAFRPLGVPAACGGLLRNPMRVPRSQVPGFLMQTWPSLQQAGVDANFVLEDFELQPQPPRFSLELKGGLAQLSGTLQCAYGARVMTLGVTAADEGVWVPDPKVITRYATRDTAAERAALARLQRSGFSSPDSQGRMQLQGQQAVLNFFAREFSRLEKEWTVTLEERLQRSTSQNLERIEPRFEVTSSGVQWFDLGVVFASNDGETFSPADIQRLLLSGQSHTRLRNGKLAIIDTGAVEELQEVLLDCAPQQHANGYRINNTQAAFLETTLRQHANWHLEAPSAWRQRAARQSGEAKLVCPPLGDLEPVLRGYQKQGVAWLWFLRENGFGGILADEMGLGKTLQALAFLQTVRQSRPDTAPMLVVCPTSLVFNWVAEAAKFLPALKVLALQGPDRHSLFSQIPSAHLVITSYALIRRDTEQYREFEFDTVILDEAQHIKNRRTQNAQAVKSVRARNRLVLTGTPLENSVLDLWSIFDFLMPGYLGSAQDFRERYEQSITKDRSVEVQARLARRLRPFLLRRLKKEVAADLPAKLEQVAFCELNPAQRGVYQQFIEATRKEVLAAVGEQGEARSRMLVLTALLRLRQVCCDLRLLKLDQTDPTSPSGKLEMFNELLEEVIDGGHRVLVFSQFVGMLALLQEALRAEEIDYCYLDGSTQNRGEVVQRFQSNPNIPVFLISLKAGGVGLNLTGADTVIHFDPWWNPAVEDQATDRAHRIGQTRVVTSYKLIARDTVEEKILTLQKRKREVIQATIGGEEQFAANLSWEEIQELLA